MSQSKATTVLKFIIMLYRLVNNKVVENWVKDENMNHIWLDVTGVTVEEIKASVAEMNQTVYEGKL